MGLSQVDLTLSQYRTLMFLDEGWAAASVLADHLAVTRPSVTAVVDGLVARALVERKHDDSDRRRVEHHLTDRGRDLLCQADARSRPGSARSPATCRTRAAAAEAFAGLELWRTALDAFRAAKTAEKGAK